MSVIALQGLAALVQSGWCGIHICTFLQGAWMEWMNDIVQCCKKKRMVEGSVR